MNNKKQVIMFALGNFGILVNGFFTGYYLEKLTHVEHSIIDYTGLTISVVGFASGIWVTVSIIKEKRNLKRNEKYDN